MKAQNENGSTLMVVMTVIFSFYLSYEVMRWKGMKILFRMETEAADRTDLEEMLRTVVVALSALTPGGVSGIETSLLSPADLDSDYGENANMFTPLVHSTGPGLNHSYRVSVGELRHGAATRVFVSVAAFVVVYITVNHLW